MKIVRDQEFSDKTFPAGTDVCVANQRETLNFLKREFQVNPDVVAYALGSSLDVAVVMFTGADDHKWRCVMADVLGEE